MVFFKCKVLKTILIPDLCFLKQKVCGDLYFFIPIKELPFLFSRVHQLYFRSILT